MKVKQLLKMYASGRRDFRGENLRGLSFKNQDLSGADFSDCDIRGTNFSEANLTGARFINAKAGLPTRLTVIILLDSLIIAFVAGFFTIYLGIIITLIYDYDNINLTIADNIYLNLASWFGLIIILGFSCLSFYQGVATGIGIGAITLAIALLTVISGPMANPIAVAGYVAVAAPLVLALIIALAGAVAFTVAYPRYVIFTVVLALFCTIFFVISIAKVTDVKFFWAVSLAGIIALAITILNLYFGWRAINGDHRDEWIRLIALNFASIGSTTFNKANLTDTDFTGAILKNANFQQARLIRTCFKGTKKLDLACPGNTYLKNLQIQKLLQYPEQGVGINLDQQDLQGINLEKANLAGASFINSNLQDANLQDADLSHARLVYALLDQADLTGATLTGAYIEGWSITTKTKLHGIKCDYVYMRLPPQEGRPAFIALSPQEANNKSYRRQPANEEEFFKEGDFTNFIAPLRDTLNLYHNKSTDPRLLALAFNKLVEDNPNDQPEIVSIEKKGQDKDQILIKVETSPTADHAHLGKQYSDNLNYLESLPPEAIRALLIERESTIRLLSGLIGTTQKAPDIINAPHFNNKQTQGDTMSNQSKNVNINNSSDIAGIVVGDNTGVVGKDMTGVAGGNISGTVTVSINELAQSNIPAAPQIADLLKQLQTAIQSEPDLSEKDKTKALKQIQVLAEAGKNPQDEEKKGLAETALDILKGVLFMEIPSLAGTVQVFKELMPLIQQYFGL